MITILPSQVAGQVANARDPGSIPGSLKKETATHASILAFEVPWTEEPGGLESMGVAKSQTQLGNYTTAQ